MPRTLLIPALLDDWFPLLRYAFASREWEPVLLREERGLADRGMRYFHNELSPVSYKIYVLLLALGYHLSAVLTPAPEGYTHVYTHIEIFLKFY